MTNFNKFFSLSLAIVLLIGGIFVIHNNAESGTNDNVSGYAWGADSNPFGGLGWVSFNCTTGGDCGTSDYGISLDMNTGSMTGHAWSSNFGWLQFGGLSNFPSPDPIYGTTYANAQVDFDNPDGDGNFPVTGWARFCAPADNPGNCSGFDAGDPNFSHGGWDGWLSLSGTDGNAGNTYGVYLTPGGTFEGYAWGGGSDGQGNSNVTGVGWVSFSGNGYAVVVETEDPVVDLLVNGEESIVVPIGDTVELAWSGTGLAADLEGCTPTGGWDDINGSDGWNDELREAPQGTYTTTALTEPGTYDYQIQCMGANGELSNIDTVTVQVGINLNLWAVPTVAAPANNWQVTLYWNATSSLVPDGSLTNCVPTTASAGTGWPGTVIAPVPPEGTKLVYVPDDPTIFTLTCQDANGNPVADSVTVPRDEIITPGVLLNNTKPVENGGVWTTSLTWTSQNVAFCEAFASSPNTTWGEPEPELPSTSGSQENVIVYTVDQLTAARGSTTCENGELGTIYSISCEANGGLGTVEDEICLNENSEASNRTPYYREE